MRATDRFQGLCLQNQEGWMHMVCYDHMPPQARATLRSSEFNICAACVQDRAFAFANRQAREAVTGDFLLIISQMEAAIRAGQH